jgi:hypothetical protein
MSKLKLSSSPTGAGNITLVTTNTDSDYSINLPAITGTLLVDPTASSQYVSLGTWTGPADGSTVDLFVSQQAVFQTSTNAYPVRIARTNGDDLQYLDVGVDDQDAIFNSSQDEAGRYGGYIFRSTDDAGNTRDWLKVAAGGTAVTINDAFSDSTGIEHFKMLNHDTSTLFFANPSVGRLGIGTNTPQAPLTVAGEIRLVHAGSDGFAVLRGPQNRDLIVDVDANDADDCFIVRDFQAGVEMFACHAQSRNVRIAPSNGGYGWTFYPTGSGEQPYVVQNKTGAGETTAYGFQVDSSTVGDIRYSTTGVTYRTTSDRRLKDNIETITDGTDKLMAMNPVTHTWKATPDAPAVHGFIAQEMKEVIPEAVGVPENEDEMMAMDYGRITPVIVAALQDAHKKIAELEEKLAKLEAK